MSAVIAGATLAGAGISYLGAKKGGEAAATAAKDAAALDYQQYLQSREDLAPWRNVGEQNLNLLAGYGPSKTRPGSYIPPSAIPEYQRSVAGDYGDVPGYNPLVDITSDPSYQFRQQEMERAVNRNMAGMGKLTSGNRLDEIMQRTGDLASQEYQAAYGRNLQDYLTRRETEGLQYGRDYGRDVDQYGRDLTAYNAAMQQEAALYGRGEADYGRAYGSEMDYLNRLAALSNVGQTSTAQTAQLGAISAENQGQALQAAGLTQAAGTI
ncbi:MAG: hypothetical protein KJO69_06260, partial [Gammaproteobacteria bacterium]|nr:hypothetical protein [Gammaproteobacteria bacterium]